MSHSQLAKDLNLELPAIHATLMKLLKEGKVTRPKPDGGKGPFVYSLVKE